MSVTQSTGRFDALPDEQTLADTVTALEEQLGLKLVASRGPVQHFVVDSIEKPDEYWRAALKYCRIVWSKDYTAYADFSAGKEFPKWFVNGELNWTDTALAWADEPSSAARW